MEVKAKCLPHYFGYDPDITAKSTLALGDSELQAGESIPNLGSLLKCRKGIYGALWYLSS